MRFVFAVMLCLCASNIPLMHAQTGIETKALGLLAECRQAMGEASPNYSIQGSGTLQDAGAGDAAGTTFTFRNTGRLLAVWNEKSGAKTVVRQWEGRRSRVVGSDGKSSPMGISDSIYRIPDLIPSYACQLKGVIQPSEAHFIGVEQKHGHTVDHVRIRMDDGQLSKIDENIRKDVQSFDLYLDSDSHRIVSITRFLVSPQALQNRQVIDLAFSDYKIVAGVLVPQRVSRTLGRQEYDVIVISEISESSPLKVGDFQ